MSPHPAVGICPLGYYCDDMITPKQCPAGTYGNTTGAPSLAAGCQVCPPGYFCPPSTAGYPTSNLRCPPGHYCLAGTSTQFENPCPDGTYSTNLGNEKREQCQSCEPGYYCQGGEGVGNKLCPSGHYCPANTTAATQHPCPAGYYTEERGATSKF